MGQPRCANEDRDDANVARQRRLDLQACEIVRVIEASPSVVADDRQPPIGDVRRQHIAVPDRGGDHLGKVIAHLNPVDVLLRGIDAVMITTS
jgi:hypothetical protein